MKKFISMMIVLTLCMAVIPSGITAFADNAIKYTEDLTAHIDAYKTANSVNDLSGTADMPGTYGTFNHKLQMYCAIQSNEGYRLVTYNTKPNIINYNFYNIENNKYVDLKAATISAFIRNESGSLTGTGTLELRYMYVSDENYFSVILDYEQNKAYGVAMKNGVKTSTEISGVKFSAVDIVTVEVGFNSSTAECRIYSSSNSFDVTKTINVSNIDYLKENSTNLSQFVYTADSGALNMLWLKNVSYTCSIKEKVKYNTTKSIGSNEYGDKELKILGEGISPRTAFKYGSIDMKVSDNNISCTQTGYSDGVNMVCPEDLAAHLDAYNQANSSTEISGTVSMPCTYGTFKSELPKNYSSIKNDYGWRLSAYKPDLNIMTYTLDRIAGMKFDSLKSVSLDISAKGFMDRTKSIGQLELCYLYVSEDNYFSILMDYTKNTTYAVVKNNGAETRTEIEGVNLENTDYINLRLHVDGTTVNCNIYNIANEYNVTKKFEVANIEYLSEKCNALAKYKYTSASWGLNMVWLYNMSHECEVKPDVTKSDSILCFGTGVHSRPSMLYTMNLTNENKDYSKIKFGIKLKNADAFDDFTLNFGYVPYTEDPNKMADFDYYRRTLLYGHNIKDYLAKTTEWQNIEIPLSIFTADASNKFAVPGTSDVFTWERVDWKNFNIIMFSVDKDAENQGFELRDVSIITPEKRECTAEFMLASSSGEPVKRLSDVKGKSIDCFIRANNDKANEQEIMPVLLVYKNGKLVDIITGKMTAQSNETTSGHIKLFDVPQNTEGFSLKLFLAGPENILDIRSEILTYK